jgi:exopolysaccharide biosynthesis polyprenyl glycosylphosphotransferase
VLRRYSQVFRSLCAVADLAAASGAFAAAYFVSSQLLWLGAPPPAGAHRDYFALWIASLPMYLVLIHSRKMYEPRRQASTWQEARVMLEVAALGTLVLTAFAFFSGMGEISRLSILCSFVFTAASLVALRSGVRWALAAARSWGFNSRRVLIAGTGRLARDIEARLKSHPEMGFQISGFVGPRHSGWQSAAPILGPFEALREMASLHEVDHVFIALDRMDACDPIKLVHDLRDSTASVRVAVDMSGLQTIRATGEELDGVPVLCIVDTPVVGWPGVAKRSLDVLVAGALLLLLAPLLAGIGLAVRWTSPEAPVLYRQRRVSLDGREFTMIKFRSMVPDAEAETGPTWAHPHDSRRTRIGRFLRRTSLDELPQLWNVLRGQMSLVGPRPERPELIARFRSQIGGYMLRHKMKGGLTGLAQIHGLRGDTPLEQRLAYDLRYACEWSLGLDLKILLLTALRIFRDPNAY